MQAELVFAQAKAFMRRHVRRIATMNPFDAMAEALENVSVSDCRGYIKKCGMQYCM